MFQSSATYNISSRIEQIGAEEKKTVGCTILYQTGNQSLAQLLDFPIDSSMAGTEGFHVDSPEQIAAKQAMLPAQKATDYTQASDGTA